MRHGFSLLELSIVLVIIGLLAGGVMAGQSLIRAAELRGVMNEYQRYRTALNAFRDKYQALPGDMKTATSVWGDQATGTDACADAAIADGTPGTCNGNGNGWIGNGATSAAEGVRAWQQMALSGLVEGNFTGYYATGPKLTIGVNIPPSKIQNAGWSILYRDTVQPVWGNTGNYLLFGSEQYSENWGNVLSPIDMVSIDLKIDDGKPDYGIILADGVAACITPADVSSVTPAGGHSYLISSSAVGCSAYFKP